MNKVTIAQAFEMFQNIQEKEELIQQIVSETGATRKAVVRKLGQLMSDEKDVEQEFDESEDCCSDCEQDSGFDEEDPVKHALVSENSKLRRQLKKISVERGGQDLLISEIGELVPKIEPKPMAYCGNKDKGKKNVTEVWHWTDFHIGEVIDRDEIEGLNNFNYEIAQGRVKLFVEKTLDWTKLHRNNYQVDELVILCTGDMVSGDIHDELTRTNEFTLPEQCVKAGELIASAIAQAALNFKKVRVEYVVADNHSRLTVKPQAKQAGYNSMNYIVGTLAKIMLEKYANVEFNLYPVVYQLVQIQNTKYLCCHGNNIRSFGAIPRAGMAKLVGMESFYRMKKNLDLRFDKLVLGHYHSASFDQTTIMGSSLTGSNEYDRNCGRLGRASQTAWFIYDDYEFDWTEFYLD